MKFSCRNEVEDPAFYFLGKTVTTNLFKQELVARCVSDLLSCPTPSPSLVSVTCGAVRM